MVVLQRQEGKRKKTGRDLARLRHEKKTSRNWAGLPHNILDEIIDRLVDLSDYIRFASVCLYWRSAALDDRNHRGKKNQVRPKYLDDPQLPMLMLPHWSKEYRGQFYSVTSEKILNFQLQVPYYSKRLIGSSCGWLISVDTDFAVTLFSPFSASTVRLPPVVNSDVRSLDDGSYDIHYFNHEYYFVKAILSADPALHPNEYVVMLIYGDMKRFAYIRPGGGAPCWFHLELCIHGFCDVIYSKSSRLFYALRQTGEVFSIDIDNNKAVCFTPALEIEIGDSIRELRYIVETRSDGLLQVIRFLHDTDPPFRRKCLIVDIKVFKLEKTSSSTTPVWAELKSLGDNALFLGDCTSMCVTASDYPGCSPGSVYYSLPFLKFLCVAVKPFWDRLDCDMGVANIEGKLVDPFQIRYKPNVITAVIDRPPIWVVPTFQERGQRDRKDLLCNGD